MPSMFTEQKAKVKRKKKSQLLINHMRSFELDFKL